MFIQYLFADLGLPPPTNLTPEERQAELHRILYNFVTGMGTLPPEQWAWEELGAFLHLAQTKPVNLLLSTYWTMGAVRHGDYVAKVRVAPVQSFADRVEQRALDLTITDSNLWGGRSGHTYTFTRQPNGTTENDVEIVREGKNLKGRVLGAFLRVVGKGQLEKVFARSLKAIEARNYEISRARFSTENLPDCFRHRSRP